MKRLQGGKPHHHKGHRVAQTAVALSHPWAVVWLLWARVFEAFSPLCCTALLYLMATASKAEHLSRELIAGCATYCLPWAEAGLYHALKNRSQCVITTLNHMGFLINAF